jgi:hypothetical protein
MPSVRDTAVRLGATGTSSIVHDLFRHINGVPAGRSISVRRQIAGMEGPHIKVNLIRVSPGTFTGTDLDSLDLAIADIRTVYQQVDLGVDIDHMSIDGDDGEEFRVIIRSSRGKKLLRRFRGAGNDNLDVFFVPVWDVPEFADGVVVYHVGEEPPEVPGPFRLDRFGHAAGPQKAKRSDASRCRSKKLAGQKGAAVGVNFATFGLGNEELPIGPLGLLLAHQVGHLLGLIDSLADAQNVMNYEPAGIELDDRQRDIIFSSCAIQ